MKQAKLDFLSCETRQVREKPLGVSGVVEPPPYLDFEKLLELYQSNEIYYRAVQVKAQFTIGQGWRLVDEGGGEEARNRLFQFLEDCNPNQTFDELLFQVMVDLECLGNGYLEATRDQFGRIKRLYHVSARNIKLLRDGGFVQTIGTQKRKFASFGGGETFEGDASSPSEIVHFRKYNPSSQFYGRPDSVAAIGSTMGEILARDYNIQFFENNATPRFCLVISGGSLSPKDKEELQNYMSNLKGNPHKTMVLQFPQGVTGEIKPIQTTPQEASFADYRKMNRDLMVVAHGVPPHLLGIIESGNLGGGTGQSQLQNFKNLVIAPRQRFLEERINRTIIREGLGISGWRFRFNEMDAEDELCRAQTDKILIDSGMISADEARARMGLPAREVEGAGKNR